MMEASRVSSGVFCSVCGSEMVYMNHCASCHKICLVCTHVKLHNKTIGGVDFTGEVVIRFVSDEEFRVRFANVFGLFLAGGEVVPFKVKRITWGRGSYFIVRKVVFKVVNGKLVGEAFGCFLDRQSKACGLKLSKLSRAGCYEWVEVFL